MITDIQPDYFVRRAEQMREQRQLNLLYSSLLDEHARLIEKRHLLPCPYKKPCLKPKLQS